MIHNKNTFFKSCWFSSAAPRPCSQPHIACAHSQFWWFFWHLLPPIEMWNTFPLLSFFRFSEQPLVPGDQRLRVSPLTVLAECDLLFSSLWGRRAVIWQCSRGIWDVILPGVSRDPKQIVSDHRYRKTFPWGWWGGGNEASQWQETTEQHSYPL